MPKVKTKFGPNLRRDFPFLNSVQDDPHYVDCSICDSRVSIANRGRADIRAHTECLKHKKALESGGSHQTKVRQKEFRIIETNEENIEQKLESDVDNNSMEGIYVDEVEEQSEEMEEASMFEEPYEQPPQHDLLTTKDFQQRMDTLEMNQTLFQKSVEARLTQLEILLQALIKKIDNSSLTSRAEPPSSPRPTNGIDARPSFLKYYNAIERDRSQMICKLCSAKIPNVRNNLAVHINTVHPTVQQI